MPKVTPFNSRRRIHWSCKTPVRAHAAESARIGAGVTVKVVANAGPSGARFRSATLADVEGILDVQQPGAVVALAHIFPQAQHPFPREEIATRWCVEIADIETAVYVSTDDTGRINGFAARREAELLHFGTAVESWGTGLAVWLHDELLATFPPGVQRLRLRVFAQNLRARRFWGKCGWTETGLVTRTEFAPHPVLVEYERLLERGDPFRHSQRRCRDPASGKSWRRRDL